MSRTKTQKLKKTHQEIDLTAANLANKKAREVFLGNQQLAVKIMGLMNKNLQTLRRSWAPFQADFDARSGFGLKLKVQDTEVRTLLVDEGLYDIAEEIAAESIKRAIMIHQRTFITTLLEDLILRPSDEAFYGPARAWPGDTHDRHLGRTYI